MSYAWRTVLKLFVVLPCLLVFSTSCISFLRDTRPDNLTGRHAAAITAADSISFSDDRTSVLKTLAAKPDLTESEQIYLVNVTTDRGFGEDQADVLVVLAKNPCLTEGARMHLAENLHRVSFSGERERVASALAANPGPPAASDPAAPAE